MAIVVRVDVPVQPGYDQTFRSKDGPVGRTLSDRATRVQLAAKNQAHVARPRPGGPVPGLLKQDITKNWLASANPNDLAISVGSTLGYALMHHEGTGPHLIMPRTVRALRWVDERGVIHFARAVHHPGTEANHYLTDNLYLAGQ